MPGARFHTTPQMSRACAGADPSGGVSTLCSPGAVGTVNRRGTRKRPVQPLESDVPQAAFHRGLRRQREPGPRPAHSGMLEGWLRRRVYPSIRDTRRAGEALLPGLEKSPRHRRHRLLRQRRPWTDPSSSPRPGATAPRGGLDSDSPSWARGPERRKSWRGRARGRHGVLRPQLHGVLAPPPEPACTPPTCCDPEKLPATSHKVTQSGSIAIGLLPMRRFASATCLHRNEGGASTAEFIEIWPDEPRPPG